MKVYKRFAENQFKLVQINISFSLHGKLMHIYLKMKMRLGGVIFLALISVNMMMDDVESLTLGLQFTRMLILCRKLKTKVSFLMCKCSKLVIYSPRTAL